MSAVTSIALYDAQATPVLHTFIPLGPDQRGAWWFEDQTGNNAIGYGRISLQLVRPTAAIAPGTNSGERTSRVKITLSVPSLESLGTSDSGITPPPTVAYTPRFVGEFIMSERSSLLERKTLRKYIDFLMADAQVTAMIENLQAVY